MVFNQLDIHLLITAICVISSALICYTIGVWGERFQGQLKAWHLWFFVHHLAHRLQERLEKKRLQIYFS